MDLGVFGQAQNFTFLKSEAAIRGSQASLFFKKFFCSGYCE